MAEEDTKVLIGAIELMHADGMVTAQRPQRLKTKSSRGLISIQCIAARGVG